MIWLVPLAADLEDFIFPLVVVIFVIISFVGQLLAKLREAQRAGQQGLPQAGPQGPIPRPGVPQAGAPPRRDPVQDELDQFLRRAAGRGAAGKPQPASALATPSTRRPIEPEPEVILEEDASVAEHVREHVGREHFGRLASDVGRGLAKESEKIEGRLHEVFDHRVGSLQGMPGESARVLQAEEAETPEDRITALPATAAAGLVAMFANPGNVRQAILISEVLQRPEHRWE